jgi:hypothetical protein
MWVKQLGVGMRVSSVLSVATMLMLMATADGFAESCNPVVDGTYCASQAIRPKSSNSLSAVRPIQGFTSDFAKGKDQPATLGAITFQGRSRCVGFLRQTSCN